MLFEAKVGLARATAVTSRTTGRGGGTTLPGRLLLGNLFRDQLDRYGELELIAAGWRDLAARLGPVTALVSNADDPLVASIGRDRARHIWFGLDDPAAALPEMQHAADSKWCVRC